MPVTFDGVTRRASASFLKLVLPSLEILLFLLFCQIFLRVLVKGSLATRGAEIILLSPVFGGKLTLALINLHLTNRIN